MKKYSVFELKVVRVRQDNRNCYFICKYNELKDIYIEVLTNEKIKVDDKDCVEPLSDYYSTAMKVNVMTRKPLMLDKYLILKEYIGINEYNRNNENLDENMNLLAVRNPDPFIFDAKDKEYVSKAKVSKEDQEEMDRRVEEFEKTNIKVVDKPNIRTLKK